MSKLWSLLKNHWASDFNKPMYLVIASFLAMGIALNYTVNLENGIIDRDAGKPIRIVWYFLLYGIAYFVGSAITFLYQGCLDRFRSLRYWLTTVTGLVILSCNVGFPYLTQLVWPLSANFRIFSWAYSVSTNLINLFITAAPLFILSFIIEKKREYFGVNRANIDLKPYWQILLVLIPIIGVASFESGFRNYYPTYKQNQVAAELGWPEVLPVILYELAYGIDFFNIEFMFRGFMVVGLSQMLGKDAILPMVCTYCFLHFGKPVGECISSIFGGYVLGVVACYTRNIWGGVIVHIGLAWMMEVAAFVQRAARL